MADKPLDTDPDRGSLAQPSENSGYIASRELYRLLGLVPPREIVSFEESIRLRLDDDDPELPNEVAKGIAIALARDKPSFRPDGGVFFSLKDECIPPTL